MVASRTGETRAVDGRAGDTRAVDGSAGFHHMTDTKAHNGKRCGHGQKKISHFIII